MNSINKYFLCGWLMVVGYGVPLSGASLKETGAREQEVDQWRLLVAIALVETPHGIKRGRAGELTRYQILPATWRRFSSRAMATASSAEIERVARGILQEIDGQLRAQGLAHTPHNYALRWNAGARARHFKPESWVYADRVEAIYLNHRDAEAQR